MARQERVEAVRETNRGRYQHLREERPPRLGFPGWKHHREARALPLHHCQQAGDEVEGRVGVGPLLPEVLAEGIHRRCSWVGEARHIPGDLCVEASSKQVQRERTQLARKAPEQRFVQHPVGPIALAATEPVGAVVDLPRDVGREDRGTGLESPIPQGAN